MTAELEGSANIDGVSVSLTESGDGPVYGVGLTADLENRFFIRGDFTHYDVEGGETEAVMLGACLRF